MLWEQQEECWLDSRRNFPEHRDGTLEIKMRRKKDQLPSALENSGEELGWALWRTLAESDGTCQLMEGRM